LLRPFIQVIQPQWASSNASRPTAPEPKLDLSQPQDAALYAQRCQAKVHQGEHLTAQENQNLERICSRFPDTADLIQTIRTTVEKSNVLHVNHLLQRMEAESFEPGANLNPTALQQAKSGLAKMSTQHSNDPVWESRLRHLETQFQRIALRKDLEAFQKRLKNAQPLSSSEWEQWQSLSQQYAEDVARLTEPTSSNLRPFPALLNNQVWVLDYLPLVAFHQALNPALMPQNAMAGESQSNTPSKTLVPWIDLPRGTQDDIHLAVERGLITVEQLKKLQSDCLKATFSKLDSLLHKTPTPEPALEPMFQEHVFHIASYLEEIAQHKGALSRKQSETADRSIKLLGVLLVKQGLDFTRRLFASPGFSKTTPAQQQILMQALTDGIITLSTPQHLEKPIEYRKSDTESIETKSLLTFQSLLSSLLKTSPLSSFQMTPFQAEFLQALPHEQTLSGVLETLSHLPEGAIPYKQRDAVKNTLKACFTPTNLSVLANISPTLLPLTDKSLILNNFHQFLAFLYEDGLIQTRSAVHKLDLSHPPKKDSPLPLPTDPKPSQPLKQMQQLIEPSLVKLCQLYKLETMRAHHYQSLQKLLTTLKGFRQCTQGVLYLTQPLQGIPDNRLSSPLNVMTYNVHELEIPEGFDHELYQGKTFSSYWQNHYHSPMPINPDDEAYQTAWKDFSLHYKETQDKMDSKRRDLTQKIRQANPDVLILQESHGLNHLLRFLQNHSLDGTYTQIIYAPAVHCANGAANDPAYFQCRPGIAILAKKDIPLDTHQMGLVHRALGEQAPGPRGMPSITIGKPTDRTRLQLVGVHLKAFWGEQNKTNDEAIQTAELGQLEEYAHAVKNLPTLALGDFNRPAVQIPGLKELMPDNADIGTYSPGGARKIVHHAADSGKTSANRLDKVFLKDEDNRLAIHSIQILAKENEPSDHRPVMVSIQEKT
jgi:endonuclease/exonuclease/phosphatase family metal-dependent hydrolase